MKAKAKNGKMVTVIDLGRAKTRDPFSKLKYVTETVSTGQKMVLNGSQASHIHKKTYGI